MRYLFGQRIKKIRWLKVGTMYLIWIHANMNIITSMQSRLKFHPATFTKSKTHAVKLFKINSLKN
jgi:hypothetical protein